MTKHLKMTKNYAKQAKGVKWPKKCRGAENDQKLLNVTKGTELVKTDQKQTKSPIMSKNGQK